MEDAGLNIRLMLVSYCHRLTFIPSSFHVYFVFSFLFFFFCFLFELPFVEESVFESREQDESWFLSSARGKMLVPSEVFNGPVSSFPA